MIMESYYYFIHKNSISAGSEFPDKLPQISKVKREKWPINAYYSDRNSAEGPFESLLELKKKSFILAEVKLQKHRQKILKSDNIIENEGFIFNKKGTTYTNDYINAFAHITIGKISNSKVKGVHFYNSKVVRILEKIYIDPKTNCYSAKIEKLNQQTGQWIEKDKESTFFPD
jgi:hypothetical protein